MMEFMTVNDFEIKKKHSKHIINVRKEIERKISDELIKGYNMPKNTPVFIYHFLNIVGSRERYVKNIKRILGNHNKNVASYKSHHPGYKLVFAVCDLSEDIGINPDINVFSCNDGELNSYFSILDIDIIVWFSPFYRGKRRLQICDLHALRMK